MTPIEGISMREFAKRDGCDDKFVREGVRKGYLKKLPNGKLDPALVGSGWRAGNRRPVKTIAQQAAETVANAQEIPDIADSEAKKEFYLAKLRELEYDTKAATVASNDAQLKLVSRDYAEVRTALLAIPSEVAPALHRCRTPAEIEAELRRRIVMALEAISRDGDSGGV